MGALRNAPGFLGTGGNLLVDLTLVIEILFYISLCLGVTAQLRSKYKWHDRFQIPVVVLNLFFIAFVMIPTFIGIAQSGLSQAPTVVLAHAGLGILAQGLAIYCLLAGLKILPRKIGVLRYWMWTTFVLWTLTILLGVGVYISFYTGSSAAGGDPVGEHDGDLVAEHAATEIEAAPTQAPVEVIPEHAEEAVAEEPATAPAEVVEEHAEAPVELAEEHAEATVEADAEPTATPTLEPTPVPARLGLLTFSDGAVHSDRVSLALAGVTPPSDGSIYEAWLEGEDGAPFSIGPLTVTGDTISHEFVDPEGRNLLGLYNAMFISVEPANDSDPAPSEVIAYTGEAPIAVMEPIRLAVVASPNTPDGDSPALNALATTLAISQEVEFQQTYSIPENDLAALHIQAEGIVNSIEGANGPNYGDLDGNGEVYDQSDHAGLLSSDSSEGYLPGVLNQAIAASQVAGASPEVVQRAGEVQLAAENAMNWAEQIRDLELQILQADDTAAVADLVTQVADLTDALADVEGSGLTDLSQGGVRAIYTYSQLMGSIEIFAVPSSGAAPAAEPTPELINEHAAEELSSEHEGN